MASGYNYNAVQKLHYFHNPFKQEAFQFYDSAVRGNSKTFADACQKMRDHFQGLPSSSRKATLIQKHYQPSPDIIYDISNRACQCPYTYRHEFHGVDVLKNPLMGEAWAESTLMKVNQQTQFQALYTYVANELQFHEELRVRKKTNNDPSDSETSKPFIYFK